MRIIQLSKIAFVAISFLGLVLAVGCKKDEHDKDDDANPVETPQNPQNPNNPTDTVPNVVDSSSFIPGSTAFKNNMLDLVNAQRKAGCDCGGDKGYFAPTDTLTWNDTLEMSAYYHCWDMYSNNFFSHTGSDSSGIGERISRQGYNWVRCGENIARGQATIAAVVAGWMKSPGHCSNIMNPNFKEIGVSKVGEYWTQNFGTKSSNKNLLSTNSVSEQ